MIVRLTYHVMMTTQRFLIHKYIKEFNEQNTLYCSIERMTKKISLIIAFEVVTLFDKST